jgi:hypothetical protein
MEQFYITLLSDSSINLYPENSLSSFRNDLARPVNLQRGSWAVGLTEISYFQDERTSKEFRGLNKTPMFVYCNLIEPQLVGNSYVRCLRIIRFPRLDGHHVFNNVYYVPVELNSFQTVAIELVNKLGDLASIPDSVNPTILVLHFKKVL